MVDDDQFLKSIPSFLRRPEEPAPESPLFMTPAAPVAPAPATLPAPILAAAEAPARRPGSLVSPTPVVPTAPPGSAPVGRAGEWPTVVSLPRRPAESRAAPPPTPAESFFAEARDGIEELLAGQSQNAPEEDDDAAFQVTLPRGVIRQIRILAAQDGTTQRAVILRALRMAGLAVPEGADIDRRILAGKRRQHA